MTETIFLLRKHRLLKNLCFLLFYTVFSNHISAQEIYFRVSENDCNNYYTPVFSVLHESTYQDKIKFLLPISYQGKRFDNLNKLYFENKLTMSKVVFSDELYQITSKPLNDLSGISLVNKGEVIAFFSIKDINAKNINTIIKSLSSLQEILDKSKKGLSNNLLNKIDYKRQFLFLSDQLFGRIYRFDGDKSEFSVLNLKEDSSSIASLRKHYLSEDDYKTHQEYGETSKSFQGQNGINIIDISFAEEKIYIKYTIPYVSVMMYAGKQATVLSNLLLMFSQPIDERITFDSFIDNTYVIKNFSLEEIKYYPSRQMAVYADKLYYINQVMASSKIPEFPLLSQFKIDKDLKEITLEGEVDNLKNFNFQQDSLLNVQYLMEIGFLQNKENILLREYPYAVNLAKKQKYQLDWEDENKHYYPVEIFYSQLQFWEKEDNFTVLVKKQENYTLKTYNQNWELQQEKLLPFNTETVKDIRFSKDNIYLFTENELLSLPNVFE